MTPQANTTRVTTRTLLLLFVAFLALVIGIFNLRDRVNQKAVMTDGAVWRDDPQFGIVADKIEPASPATRAGVWRGDILIGISPTGNRDDMEEVRQAQDVQIYIDQAKDRSSDPGKAYLSYWVQHRNDAGDTLLRDGIADVELTARTTHDLRGLYLALIGLIYLGIGVYFLLRQGRAPYATHFFLLCLLAFIAHFYSPTEELRAQFDKAIDLADAIALILLGPMFMHFAAIYPERDHLFSKRQRSSYLIAALLYLPTALLILAEAWIRTTRLRALLPLSAVNVRALCCQTWRLACLPSHSASAPRY